MDLVLGFREYDDTESDVSKSNTFKWELSEAAVVETNLIKAIQLEISEDVVVVPSGWLFSCVADILSTDYVLPNPNMLCRNQVPATMWIRGGIKTRTARTKALDCMSSHGCGKNLSS